MLNMIESRVMEHTWRAWEPNLIYVLHQAPPNPVPHLAAAVRRADRAARAADSVGQVNMIGMAIAQGLAENEAARRRRTC